MDHVPRFGHGRRLQTLANFLDFQVYSGARSRRQTALPVWDFLARPGHRNLLKNAWKKGVVNLYLVFRREADH